MITKYSNMPDDELLQSLTEKRLCSPVIDELCNRLERDITHYTKDTNFRVECPVCEALLEVEPDPGNDMFNLVIDRESTR